MNPVTILYLMSALSVGDSAPATDDIPANLRPEYVQMTDSADYYITREMWTDAKRCTVGALRSDPSNFNNALLLSNLGIINLNLGETDEAISNFTLGLSIAPASTTLRANRARAYLGIGDYGNARHDLLELVDASPEDPWALKMLGITYLADKDTENALTYFSRISEPDPDTLRLMASIAMDKNDHALARRYYDRLIEESPSEESWYDRALFYIITGDLSSASDDIREGLKMYPRDGALVLLRAYIHFVMHENELAEMDKKLAMEYGVETELVNRFFPPRSKKK